MKKLAYLGSIILFLTAIAIPSAPAAKVHVSFVAINPITRINVGAGNQVTLFQVNRHDRQEGRTDSSGVVSFDIANVDYILSWYCNFCSGDFKSNQGTQYLVSPQADGTVKIFSAADEVMKQDASGNWIIGINLKRVVTGKDLWQLVPRPQALDGSAEHMYLMTNGKVLIQSRGGAGGGFEKWWLLTPDANGNYLDGTWEQAAQPPAGYNPQNVNGAVLHSGNFIIVGGEQNTAANGAFEENSNQSYLYDVVKNTWTFVTPPNNGEGDWTGIGAAPFAELADGRIMVGWNGGRNTAGLYAMLFDPKTSTWTATGTNKHTSNGEQGYTLLSNDKILNIWNGDDSPELVGYTEIFDPQTGLWTPAARIGYDLGHGEIGPALTLPNGKVLAMGATGRNALYDPILNSWTTVPDFPKLKNGLQAVAADNPAAVLPNGNVLVQTSAFVSSTEGSFFMAPGTWYEYDTPSNTWITLPDDLITPASGSIANGTNMLVLPNGQIMVSSEYGYMNLYTPTGKANASWLPIIDSISATSLSPKITYTLSGKQLAGLTQGTFWGDEQQNATNYGLVQITNKATQHVFYARVTDYSNTSIAPNVPSTFSFTFDEKVEDGPSSIRVVASGVASLPFDVNISGGFDKVAADKAIADKAAAEAKVIADAKAAADKAAADLKAKQEADAKAAADLKAKQEADAKAAADLKAKQEADAKAAADKAAAAKVTALKKITITCVKGKLTKKVTAVKPVCPAGYKKK